MSVIKKNENEMKVNYCYAMIDIQNNQDCFVQLWLRLERTRKLLQEQCKHFCIRRVLQIWAGPHATDDFIWEVCTKLTSVCDETSPVGAYDPLPPPKSKPRIHRELLRAIVAVSLGIGMRKVNIHAIDAAYKTAFPHGAKLDVNKNLNNK